MTKMSDSEFWLMNPEAPDRRLSVLWRAGEVRPFATLRIEPEAAGFSAYCAGLAPAFAVAINPELFGAGPALSWAATLVCSMAWLLAGLAPGIEAASSRRMDRAGVLAAVRQVGAGLMDRSVSALSPLAWVAGLAAKTALRPVRSIDGAAEAIASLDKFGDAVRDLSKKWHTRVDNGYEADLFSLTEVGAWRLALKMMNRGRPEAAARAWLARPFNPEWRVGAIQAGAARGVGPSSFVEALEFAARIDAGSPKGNFCAQTACIARSMMERRAISGVAATPEPSRPDRHSPGRL